MAPSGLSPHGGVVYNIVFTFSGACFVFTRLYVRYFINGRARWAHNKAYIASDCALVFALIVTIAFSATDTWLRFYGKGKLWDTGAENLRPNWYALLKYIETSVKLLYPLVVMALVQLLAVKVSFICLYYEVAEDLSRRARQLLHLAAFCVILVCGVFILVYGFARCIPFRRYWSIGSDNCLAVYAVEFNAIMSVADIFSDICVIAMGWIVVTQSKGTSGGVTSGAAFITVLGVLTIACTCIRAAVSVEMASEVAKGPTASGKESYQLAEWLVVVGLAEFNIALIAASLPAMRVWVRRYYAAKQDKLQRLNEDGLGTGRRIDEEMSNMGGGRMASPLSPVLSDHARSLQSKESTTSMEFENMVSMVEDKSWANSFGRNTSRRAIAGTE